MSLLADMLGFAGAGTILAGYGWQTLRATPPDLFSTLANLTGALLLAVSLTIDFNLPALCLEIAWATIATIGLVRLRTVRR